MSAKRKRISSLSSKGSELKKRINPIEFDLENKSKIHETKSEVEGSLRGKRKKIKRTEIKPLCEIEDKSQNAVKNSYSQKKKIIPKNLVVSDTENDEITISKTKRTREKAIKVESKEKDADDEVDKYLGFDEEVMDTSEIKDTERKEAERPPPINSSYLPLPWKGRLGYACLNTYLRDTFPSIFSSRTCRIASIIEHRYPLANPNKAEHATKNRPDKSKTPSFESGQRFVEALGLANVRDIPKMLRWNHKYGIKFMRLSSEMFPFASHAEYGYKLAPFASEALAEAGKVIVELGHRVSTHPGQFTQLGSPRQEVIASAIRDLEYHDELLTLLKLPKQQNADAVMIIHMGGTFGDKTATLERFRKNYKKLSKSIKQRLVLENDDVSWTVHDLLPVCEELNIPLCLDFHHHNINFSSNHLREGTLDIMSLFPRIKATWTQKSIRQKMHYSEPCTDAITARQRRKHNARPNSLPPCPNDMDLMIEAKDKEQAIFELMRIYKLPGWDSFNNIVPYNRSDDNRPLPKKPPTKKTNKEILAEINEFGKEVEVEVESFRDVVPELEVGMGGKDNRVYWPPGMEEWLRPRKKKLNK
ncbi:UV-endonuclease UvdE [Erysiphe pulchra]|uniref:UV-endonuclease UvdE n=1 Tax=Erysiphe pulchra TaxID=225359 RepID=A0A2S4Q1C1_9PEZI|nr:UV-endonuclease UvdE [Erysiphe pulchra]